MEVVIYTDWLALLRNADGGALLRMERHLPVVFPLLQGCEVLLECDGVMDRLDSPVKPV